MNWLAVACGGALGAMARYAISGWLPSAPGQFPIPTFFANVLGCFIMGVAYVTIVDKHILPMEWRPFIMVGFLGALTTFSTFSIEALALLQMQKLTLAAGYLISSVLACLFAVWLGFSLTEKFLNS